MELNTTNSHCFTYKTDELLIELLGGIRIDTLDRMRATMKITVILLASIGCRGMKDLIDKMLLTYNTKPVLRKVESMNWIVNWPSNKKYACWNKSLCQLDIQNERFSSLLLLHASFYNN